MSDSRRVQSQPPSGASHQTAHPLVYEGGEWVCGRTGERIAKRWRTNLLQRQAIVEFADRDQGVRDRYVELSSRSFLLWLNLFGWTYVLREVDESGRAGRPKQSRVPFITWPCQDSAAEVLERCVEEGEDACVDKSRDMGASWLLVSLATWMWLFKADSQVLFVSRVEELVDKRGDPDSLMWKSDFLIANLPRWMLPCEPKRLTWGGDCRSHLQLINPVMRSSIRGSATTAHVGRAGRRTFVMLDEMAAMQNATDVWRSAADTTSCRIANSTPLGAGTEYTHQFQRAVMHGHPTLVGLYYYDHPQKGRGREWRVDESGEVTGTAGRGYWWTPWFARQVEIRDKTDLAQNVLADHVASGDSFFNLVVVTRHKQAYAREPVRCELVECEGFPGARFEESGVGRWYVWDEDRLGERNCVGFCDLSHGVGSANSGCAVLDVDTGEFIAEFVDPYTSTFDLADEVCLSGRTVFSREGVPMLVGWESNGPGEDWYRDFWRNEYQAIFYRRRLGQKREKRTREYGWRSGRREKRILLTGLSRALSRGEVVLRSSPGLGEMLEYVFYEDGSIGPGSLADELSGAREAHGDRVIAYAGAVYLRGERPRFESSLEESASDRPGSFGHALGHARTWKEIRAGKYLS